MTLGISDQDLNFVAFETDRLLASDIKNWFRSNNTPRVMSISMAEPRETIIGYLSIPLRFEVLFMEDQDAVHFKLLFGDRVEFVEMTADDEHTLLLKRANSIKMERDKELRNRLIRKARDMHFYPFFSTK